MAVGYYDKNGTPVITSYDLLPCRDDDPYRLRQRFGVTEKSPSVKTEKEDQ